MQIVVAELWEQGGFVTLQCGFGNIFKKNLSFFPCTHRHSEHKINSPQGHTSELSYLGQPYCFKTHCFICFPLVLWIPVLTAFQFSSCWQKGCLCIDVDMAPFNFCASFSFTGLVKVIFKNTCPGPLCVSLWDLFRDRNPITERIPWRTARTEALCSGLSGSPGKNSWGTCRLLKEPSSSLWDIFEFPSTINSDSIPQLFLCTLTCRHDCASYCTICQDICNLYQGVTYGKYFIMLVSTLWKNKRSDLNRIRVFL